MSKTTGSLRRKIASAGDLQSVVRTMKAVAASSIGQYEQAVRALGEYHRTVELGLGACFRATGPLLVSRDPSRLPAGKMVGAVVFGSDQGLVGQFNEVVTDFAVESLAAFSDRCHVWSVGERVRARLVEAGLPPARSFAVPGSVRTIGRLVGDILVETETFPHPGSIGELHLFYHRPMPGAVSEPVTQRLLPLDESWYRRLIDVRWPTLTRPELLGGDAATLRALLREYLFISLFRACAESLASENASRLSAMERADKNIDVLLEELEESFHRLRQSSIDEELFDVISGGEALAPRGGSSSTSTQKGGTS